MSELREGIYDIRIDGQASIPKDHLSGILLADIEGKLYTVRQEMRAMPETCRLEPCTSRGAAFYFQSMV